MKTFNLLILCILGLVSISCNDDVNTLSAVNDGEEVQDRTIIPFKLEQNQPNPFNVVTTISIRVSKRMHLTLKVYTEDYVLVATLTNSEIEPGYHGYTFIAQNEKGEQLPSGDYYYTLEGEGLILVRKMRIIK